MTKLIQLGTASAETKGSPLPIAPVDNRGQYKPDTMGLIED